MSEDGMSDKFDQQEAEKKTYKSHLKEQRLEKKLNQIKENNWKHIYSCKL